MGSKCKTIVWFRRDLRIEDNPALAAAAREGSILPVFIWCREEEGQYYPGRVSRWWLKQSLMHLQQSLKSLGAELVFIEAKSTLSALLDCISAVGATKVVYNHLYDPVSLVRDHTVKQNLVGFGITVQSYNAELLYEPWEIYDDNEHAFTTFNAYWEKCLSMQKEPVLHLPPWHLVQATGKPEQCSIEALGLEDELEKSSNALLGRAWVPGWSNADKTFTEFLEHHLVNYAKDRVKVGMNSTSLLSPYLHFGELSIRKVFQCVHMKILLWKNEQNFDGENGAYIFLKAIGLREYSRYICFNFPFAHEQSLLSIMKFFPWVVDQNLFKAWRQGRTGYPLVDAGMRELWATGWIHNRIRVIISSFFVKVLRLPWQWGMKYFWDTLLDADLESDILGWQYISGGLPDGHELERLDSPQIQGFHFDPDGEYIRQWLPELSRVPNDWIHHPWDAPPTVLQSAGVDLGSNYPNPIVDIDLARDRLFEAIIIMRGKESTEMARNGKVDEVVVDNSDSYIDLGIPKVNVRERNPCSSSHDQMVPSIQKSESIFANKKRLKPMDEIKSMDIHNEGEGSKSDEDLCSTAESSSSKKQMMSGSSYSVPRHCPSISTGTSYQVQDSSDLKSKRQEKLDEMSSANCKILLLYSFVFTSFIYTIKDPPTFQLQESRLFLDEEGSSVENQS